MGIKTTVTDDKVELSTEYPLLMRDEQNNVTILAMSHKDNMIQGIVLQSGVHIIGSYIKTWNPLCFSKFKGTLKLRNQ